MSEKQSSTPEPKFTDQQAKAILTRDVSIGLSAGAGCGKTFVLTQRFLAGLDPKEAADLYSLVAITFTDRAAREMRDRIRSACHQRLQNCLSEDVDHWLAVLRGLDSARISTIHSFCTGILRSQAVEAGIDPRFSVMEPAIADTLLRNQAKETLHRLLERSDPDADELVLRYGLERSYDLLRSLVHQRFQINFEDFEQQTAHSIADKWRLQWQTVFIPMLIDRFRTSPMAQRLFQTLRENETTHAEMRERRATILHLLEPSCLWQDPIEELAVLHSVGRVQGGGGVKSWPNPEVFEVVKTSLSSLRDAVKKLQELLPINEDDLLVSAEFSLRALRVARQATAAYESAKQSQGLLDFDDLLLRVRNLLKSQPDVRDRVAASIRLLMVDEFQDTDPVQAEIVQMLCGDALTRGRLFMVGDAKQSIYRFRRADPGVFNRLRKEIPSSGQLPLSVNFRSQPAILNFVNHVFAAGMQDTYEALTPHEDIQRSPTPAIEFLFASFDAEERIPRRRDVTTRGWQPEPAEDVVTAAALRTREADWIARRCVALLADTTPRIRTKDKAGKPALRRVQPGDIVILFRALSNVQEYESALRSYGLNYYLVGGKAFFAQQEVFDLLNLCRYLDDQDDLVALVGILRSPFFNLSDDSIQALSSASSPTDVRSTNLHDNLQFEPPAWLPEEQQERLLNARRVLNELRSQKDRLPLAKLLSLAIERTGYDASLLTEFMGSRKVANLFKLIEMASEFDQAEFLTLKDFVQRLHTSVLEETDEEFATTLPETGEVIRLMSIHQSKGLEFPVVIVADIDRKKPPRGKSAVLHPDMGALVKLPEAFGRSTQNLGMKMHDLVEKDADEEETIRLFYVACTRAADYLILSAGLDPEKVKHSPWLQLVESRFHLDTGLPKTDPLLGSSEAATAGRESIPSILVHHAPAKVKRPSQTESVVPINQLNERLEAAEPGEIPSLAIPIARDETDLPPLSVSYLEAIDAARLGIGHVRPDRNTNFAETTSDVDQATTLGSLIHAVLERIDFEHPHLWPELLNAAADTLSEDLTDRTVSSAADMISRLLASPVAAELARARNLYREVEFVLQWPSTAGRPTQIRGILDVLYEDSEGGWHILDYKTNDFAAHASDEQLLAPYEFQLAVYAHAITQWLGEPPRELSLITLRPSVRRICLPWSESRSKAMEVRIHTAIESCRVTT